MECPEKVRSYLHALEEERRKIQVFQRELPLCLELVTQAIEACKHQLSDMTTVTTATNTSMEGMNGQISECSEQNSMKGSPVLEEFIPIKKASSYDDHMDQDDAEDVDEHHSGSQGSDNDKKKSNWLKSAQLWNPNPEATHHEDPPPLKRASVLNGKTNAFPSFLNGEKPAGNSSPSSGTALSPMIPGAGVAACTSSTAEKRCDGAGKREEKQKPNAQRKQRRCWSSDLHRRFLHALQQLGGPHVATPKQIRELMKIDGLTNDEVKSHLQKYRLHSKNCPPQNSKNAVQPPRLVVVGGIWMPQPQYAAAPTSPGAAHGIYAPVAAPLPIKAAAQAQQKPRGSSPSEDPYEVHGSSKSATTSCSARMVSVC